MRARDVVGRRILAVEQELVKSSSGKQVHCIERLRLEGGVTLFFVTVETWDGSDYAIEGHAVKPEKTT